MADAEKRWGLYSVAATGGGAVLALAAGAAVPAAGVLLLIASQVVALVLGAAARATLAGRVGLVASSALLLLGVLIGLPHLVGSAPATPTAGRVEPDVAAAGPARAPAARPAEENGSGGEPDPLSAEDPSPGRRPARPPRPAPGPTPAGELFPKVPFDRKP